MTRWKGLHLESRNGFVLSCFYICRSLSVDKYRWQFRFFSHARGSDRPPEEPWSYRRPEPRECQNQEEYCALLKKLIRRVDLEIGILTKDSCALEKNPESIEGITEEQRGLLRDMKKNIVPLLLHISKEKTAKEQGEIVLQTLKDFVKLRKREFLDGCPVSHANENTRPYPFGKVNGAPSHENNGDDLYGNGKEKDIGSH